MVILCTFGPTNGMGAAAMPEVALTGFSRTAFPVSETPSTLRKTSVREARQDDSSSPHTDISFGRA